MFRSDGDQRLRRLFAARGEARPDHKGELETELMERFDRRAVKTEKARKSMVKSVLFRRIMAASAIAAALGVGACVAPADVDVDVGRSVDIRYEASGEGALDPHAVVDLVRGQGSVEEVGVRVQRQGSQVIMHLDLWGSGMGEAPIADQIRKAFPALKGATIEEEKLQGHVRGTVGKKIGHDLFDLDVINTTDVEEARKQVMAQLAAKGIEGAVEVKVENDGSKRKVMIRVEKQDRDPPEGSTQVKEPDPVPSNEGEKSEGARP